MTSTSTKVSRPSDPQTALAANATSKPLTLIEAVQIFGWFPALFTSIVGGPSILNILGMVRNGFTLHESLGWIVDGYKSLTSALASLFEPPLLAALSWINSKLGWTLELHSHWRPMFLLGLVLALGLTRAEWRFGRFAALPTGLAMIFGTFVSSAFVGMIPLESGWVGQGLIAATPLVVVGLLSWFEGLLEGWSTIKLWGIWGAVVVAPIALSAFVLAAGLSLVPALKDQTGFLVLAAYIALIGRYLLRVGLSEGGEYEASIGLTLLGGFAASALILSVDALLKFFS